MNYFDPELRDRIAAEYALGTLRSLARRRFERLLSANADLRDLVSDWELRANLLAESAPVVEPPAHVWEQITQRIAPPPAPARERLLDRLWDNPGFWRVTGALAGAVAAALAVYVALQPPGVRREQIAALDERLARIEGATQGLAEAPNKIAAFGDRLAGIESRFNEVATPPSHVAVLLDKDRRPMMNADLDVADGRLVLRLNIKPPRDFTGRILEVWLVPPAGTPRSLGVFPAEKSGTTAVLLLSHDTARALANSALAVSLEPSGGSTTGVPSGPILFSGALVAVDL
jgi:anti-sigma-K factor RskA